MGRDGDGLLSATTTGGSFVGAKAAWPELVGSRPVDAVVAIKSQRPDVYIKLFGAGEAQPPEFEPHRVCVFVDVNTITVARTPKVG